MPRHCSLIDNFTVNDEALSWSTKFNMIHIFINNGVKKFFKNSRFKLNNEINELTWEPLLFLRGQRIELMMIFIGIFLNKPLYNFLISIIIIVPKIALVCNFSDVYFLIP